MALSTYSQDCFYKLLSHSLNHASSEILADHSLSESAANDGDISGIRMTRIMLTISGINFRATFLLHYACDGRLAKMTKNSSGDDAIAASTDNAIDLNAYFLEFSNRFCGEAKRLFYESFEYLGMSTPCILSEATTLCDMAASDLIYSSHVKFNDAEGPVLAGSIYVYSQEDIDFDLDITQLANQTSSGELEFF